MGTPRADNRQAGALFGVVRQRVLGLLFGRSNEEFYLRQITRAVAAGHGAVQRELRQLVEGGLATRTRRGNQTLYQANRRSPIFAELRALIVKTVGMADVLRDALEPLREDITCAFVFGSIAEGTDRGDSDVDLMVVTPLPLMDVATALRPAQERLGREINPVRMTPEEFDERIRQRDHFVQSVVDGPRIPLIGDEDALRLADESSDQLGGRRPPADA
jgi:predicted nucleotidyltransferase